MERRRFLQLGGGGAAVLAAGSLLPPADASAAITGSHLSMASWAALSGATVTARDAAGHRFGVVVESVTDATAAGANGQAFHVVLRSAKRRMADGIYTLTHRALGGSAQLFLVGAGSTAVLAVDLQHGTS